MKLTIHNAELVRADDMPLLGESVAKGLPYAATRDVNLFAESRNGEGARAHRTPKGHLEYMLVVTDAEGKPSFVISCMQRYPGAPLEFQS